MEGPALVRRLERLMAKKRSVYCDCCQVWLNGEAQHSDHLAGARHLKNMKKIEAQKLRGAVAAGPAPGGTEGLTKETMAAISSTEKPGFASGGLRHQSAKTSSIETSPAKPAMAVPGRPPDANFEASESIVPKTAVSQPVSLPDAPAAFVRSDEDDAWRNFQGTKNYFRDTQSASESSHCKDHSWYDNTWGADGWHNNSWWFSPHSDSAESGASGNAGQEDKRYKNNGWWTEGWKSFSEDRAAEWEQEKQAFVGWDNSGTGGAENTPWWSQGWGSSDERAEEQQQQERPWAPQLQGRGVAKTVYPAEGLQPEMPPVSSSSQSRWAPTVAAHRPPKGSFTVPRLEQRPLSEPQKGESLPEESGAIASASVQEEEAGARASAECGSEGSAPDELAGLDFDIRLAVDAFLSDVGGEGEQRPKEVYVFVIGGNLAHRLYKLGVELPRDQQSGGQRMLADILEKSGLGGINVRPGRTEWSNGACVYLTENDARAVDWADRDARFRVLGEELQSKHLVCSARYLGLIKELLYSEKVPDGVAGRGAFMIKRAGRIKQEICRELP